MPRPLEDATVAITGASSGIGRATALRFARRGCRLALCARAPEPLRDLARECEEAGAQTLVRALDVGDEDEVEEFAAAAVERFGRIDVWLNNAGVIAYGRFLDLPSEVFERVVRTNLMGQVHGARASVRRFREQGSGVLVNVSSVWGRISSPLVAPYVASKHAVRAFSESLAGELAAEPEIHVATVLPEAVDTPIFDKGANYTGSRIRPVPPVLATEEVAAAIERCAERPVREVTYGRAGRLLEVLFAASPTLYRRFSHRAFVRGTIGRAAIPGTPGNVLSASGLHAVDGRWRADRRRTLRRALLDAVSGALSGLKRR